MTQIVTCIECPMGCAVETETENGVVTRVFGNGCPRGKAYAESEAVCPVRVLTSTVRSVSGKMIPVKTSKPVRKSALFALMQTVNAVHPALPVRIGDILVHDIEDGVDLVATGNVRA